MGKLHLWLGVYEHVVCIWVGVSANLYVDI